MRLCNLVCFDFVDAIYLVGYENVSENNFGDNNVVCLFCS